MHCLPRSLGGIPEGQALNAERLSEQEPELVTRLKGVEYQAQAWYQLTIPWPRDEGQPQDRERLEVTVGKVDPFLFFDQNAIADDETAHFQNKAFVHNPLLDAGGDIGGDAYRFMPGLRLAFGAIPAQATRWSASVGVFAAGEAAGFGKGLGGPLLMVQLDTSLLLADGL